MTFVWGLEELGEWWEQAGTLIQEKHVAIRKTKRQHFSNHLLSLTRKQYPPAISSESLWKLEGPAVNATLTCRIHKSESGPGN